jgi:hypothetical protein
LAVVGNSEVIEVVETISAGNNDFIMVVDQVCRGR